MPLIELEDLSRRFSGAHAVSRLSLAVGEAEVLALLGPSGCGKTTILRLIAGFEVPDVPIIMLTGHVERWRVIEASRLGVNEFLKKPVSGKSLLDRIVAILTHPRAMVRLGDYYGPEPRKLFYEPVTKLIAAPPTAPKAAAEDLPTTKLMI